MKIKAPAFTAPVPKVSEHEVKKSSLNKAEIEKWITKSAEAVSVKIVEIEDRIATKTVTWFDPQACRRTYQTTRKLPGRRTE